MKKLSYLFTLAICIFSFTPSNATTQYLIKDIGNLGGTDNLRPADINSHGQVTGYAATASSGIHAFLYDGVTMHDLGTMGGGTGSYGNGINNYGHITGSANTATGEFHAFLYDGVTMHDLGTLGGDTSWGQSINDRGQVTGHASTATGVNRAFLYDGVTMHDLGTLGGANSNGQGINELGQVTGYADTATGETHAFLYDGVTMHDLGTLGGVSSVGIDIDNNGQVTGYADTATGETHAFLYDGVTMHDLGTLEGNSHGWGINDKGQVVGGFGSTWDETHAFLYDGVTMHDLNDLDILGIEDWYFLKDADAINDADQITGLGIISSGSYAAFLLTPVSVIVSIDIKPGSSQNCININDHGVIPVAILGTDDFDVNQVDPSSVTLQGMSVKMAGKSNKLLCDYTDLNGDGYVDLLLKIEDLDGNFVEGQAVATLTGELYDGTPIEGTDTICIVP